MNQQPWIEKYRPKHLHEIVLNETNRELMNNMIQSDQYPNMLFYGPPGTGKTTTIMCLIQAYQTKHNCSKNYIHLNASHERGIDVIRNHISQFTQNQTFFEIHRKFVLLDEMDSLTKQAQNNLYHIIQKSSCKNITFILICNYLNKVIPCIRNSLLMIHFNQTSMWCDAFIQKCLHQENIKIPKSAINHIKSNHVHDLRSILNALQNYQPKGLSLHDRVFKELCLCKNPNVLLKKYLQEYDLYTILCAFFKYAYKHCDLDTTIIDLMKMSLFHSERVDFFLHECLPVIRVKYKKN